MLEHSLEFGPVYLFRHKHLHRDEKAKLVPPVRPLKPMKIQRNSTDLGVALGGGGVKIPKLKMKVKILSGLPFLMFPLLFQDSLNHPLLWIDPSKITVLTISVPTKAVKEFS